MLVRAQAASNCRGELSVLSRKLTRWGTTPACMKSSIGGFLSLDSILRADWTACICLDESDPVIPDTISCIGRGVVGDLIFYNKVEDQWSTVSIIDPYESDNTYHTRPGQVYLYWWQLRTQKRGNWFLILHSRINRQFRNRSCTIASTQLSAL